jgi:Skp family chaperone for outer membrane proteins
LNHRIIVFSALCLGAVAAGTIEIPVSQGRTQDTRVGFVDMDSIYQDYPETQKARAEFRKEVARHKNAIAERERELEDLERQVRALKEAPPVPDESPAVSTGARVSPSGQAGDAYANLFSTGAPSSVQEGLAVREAQLTQRRAGLEKTRAEAVQSLRDFEAKQSKQILGRLYKALVQVAEEQGISLVVDKSAILYGQNAIDLTEALSRRVRGLPETAP